MAGVPRRVWPVWTQRISPRQPLDGEMELDWLSQALEGQSIVAVWEGEQGLVAPLSYRRYPALDNAMEASAQHGWPVRLRRSGGGVVPQGPGILNISLAFPCDKAPGDIAETLYRQFCDTLSVPLQHLGIGTSARTVEGSFCDGRFNLAADPDNSHSAPRKIAGTAQYWRRSKHRQAVLLHALLVVEAAPEHLTYVANQFEYALQSDRRYHASALTNVSSLIRNKESFPNNFLLTEALTEGLFEAFSNFSYVGAPPHGFN